MILLPVACQANGYVFEQPIPFIRQSFAQPHSVFRISFERKNLFGQTTEFFKRP